jgi:hypothetical protein
MITERTLCSISETIFFEEIILSVATRIIPTTTSIWEMPKLHWLSGDFPD